MPLGLGLLVGLANVVLIVVFVVVLYRLAGIQPTPREKRRQFANLGFLMTTVGVLVVVDALHLAGGVWVYAILIAISAYFALKALQRQHHWLVTPTDEERAMLPARREAFAAVMRGPTFWVLVGGLILAFSIISLGLVLAR